MSFLARSFLLTALVSVLAGAAGMWLGARFAFVEPHRTSLHAMVHEDLKLSSDQDGQIRLLEQDFSVKRAARERELRQANADLAAAIKAGHTYSPEVQSAVERFHHAMGELQKETILHVLAMREVLTPEQSVSFDGRIGEALTEQAP